MNATFSQLRQQLRQGLPVALPTPLGLALAADATRPEALALLPAPVQCVALGSVELLERFLTKLPEVAPNLFAFAEGPLIVELDRPRGLAPQALTPAGRLPAYLPNEAALSGFLRELWLPLALCFPEEAGSEIPVADTGFFSKKQSEKRVYLGENGRFSFIQE